jgi:DNA-3-methyladenine glycosylase II
MMVLDEQRLRHSVDALIQVEPRLAPVVAAHGYPPMWLRQPGFASLVHIILEQQVSLQSAQAAFSQLQLRLGTVSAAAFLQLSDGALKDCFFSRQKMQYCRALAAAVLQGTLPLEALARMADAEALALLMAVKGIGAWTASIYLMMCMGRPDVFPPGDIALLRSANRVFAPAVPLGAQQLLLMAQGWAPHRTAAAFLLWHAYLCHRRLPLGGFVST